ncbi:carnitine O-palmitoyltransferase 1, liver isoform-like [Uloborus diversus]|uniref:carnitine O-palmitoyltransferase 1, liver isoform-like n=1 Tax=Uloborus diversus TaxID=327109 RepID=UPI00240A3A94|nr:carnitine O-palmitoyltransferase 1, liver isoform-like [Uloborus diversus]XP_054721148.1 carnitine O-palmitoyltransferase 1, liver isoform-like [Uloborus diversus]XP_054721149.1 carnitine O-palmitoyltransferase 1, liver isoform-like [Uloborus diversus]
MAEARIAVAEPRVNTVEELAATQTWKDVFGSFRSTATKRYYKVRNLIYNGVWPASLSNVRISILTCIALMLIEPSITSPFNVFLWNMSHVLYIPKGLPRTLRALIVSCLVGFFSFIILMILRQGLLRLLLSYRGWMYETPRNHTILTTLWCGCVRLLSGYKPSLYSCQRSLPRLPVPAVRDTLNRLYESLKPLCTEEELKDIQQSGREFETTVAHKLQNLLYLKSWFCQNYVSDWWEKYAYLMSRGPLPNNSNYYCCDQCYWIPTNKPVSRAASLIYNILVFKRLIDREELEPLVVRNTIPICMAQYERLFSTVRIPGENTDKILHCEDSKHIVIQVKGIYYKLDICDSKNQILAPTTLEEQLNWIVKDAENQLASYSDVERSIASLTALKRSQWATVRKNHLCSGVNRDSRRVIEKAIFCVTLTDYVPPNLTEKGKFLLHGDSKSIWFDKSLNLIVFGNGATGMNCEHTVADAPAMAHMWEYTMSREVLEKLFDENGYCMPFSRSFKQAKIKSPQRLIWEMTPDLTSCIEEAITFAKFSNDDLDLKILDHNKWGKGVIKKCKVSPDAFVQLALQLAYYKDAGKFVQTYEASMTRLYQGGRTETVRSCTMEAKEFVLSMMQNNTEKETRKKLLQKAAAKHQNLYRDAMNGKGIDRHLFALYVACKGLGYESEFLYKTITRPWTLSTSQTPHTQLTALPDANLHVFDDKLGAGGGFGPVSDEGYGVSYLFPSDYRIFFHVSSKHSCPNTNSERFLEILVHSMEAMVALFEER